MLPNSFDISDFWCLFTRMNKPYPVHLKTAVSVVQILLKYSIVFSLNSKKNYHKLYLTGRKY